MDKVIERVYKFITQYELISKGDRIIVGLSGGSDSVFLLHALIKLKERFNIELSAVHINHLLRGSEAYRDEKFSVELAHKWGIPIAVYRIKVEPYAKAKKIGIEEASRELRYRIFKLEAKKNNAKIALGHTADDRVETFLFNLVRGSGIEGLRSIPKKRDFIIRPILQIFKREIWNYLKQEKIEFVLDSSNLSLFYTRNQIRRTLIPNLEQFNPRIKEHIYHTTEMFERLEEYIDAESETILQTNLLFANERILFLDRHISELPLILFGNIIKKSLEKLRIKKTLNFYITSTIRLAKKGIFNLGKIGENNILLERTRNGYLLALLPEKPQEEYEKELKNLHKLPENLGLISVETVKTDEITLKHEDETIGYIKASSKPLFIRFPRKGDRFDPYGKTTRDKKLARYMLERALPLIFRQYVPVICAENKIAWVAGLGISKAFTVEPQDKYALKISWQGYIPEFLKRRELWKR